MYDFNQKIDRSETKCIKYDAMDFVYHRNDLLPFWIADMDIKTPQPIIDAISARLEHPVFGYTTWRNDCFFESVQHWFKRFDARPLKQDIAYAPSVLFVITEVIRLLTKEDDGIIVNMPSYNNFINLLGGNARNIVPSKLDDALQMDMEEFEQLCARPENKIYLMCNPHNPTGKVFSSEELEAIVRICRQHDVFIICDEIHMDFVREGKHQTLVKWMEEGSRMLVATCLGKSFNISGLPHSYFITKDRELMAELNERIMNVYGLGSVNPLILEAINAAYNDCGDWMDALNVYLGENMQIVKDYIDTHLSDKLDAYIPDATFLMWIDFEKSGYAEEEVQQALQNIGQIAVGVGSNYELGESTHFRFNVGCDRETLHEGLDRLKKAFDALPVKN